MLAAIRYPVAMAMFVSTLSLLAAAATAPPLGAPVAQRSPTVRAEGGAVSFTVSARIVSASASIGAAFGPPGPCMVARRTTVSAADGRLVAALVYDFE